MLTKAHRIVAAILAIFLAQHLATHLLAAFGPEYHRAITEAARVIYRPVIIEVLLLSALLGQVIMGLMLIRRRWRLGVTGFWGWAQVVSGGYLAFFILNHTIAAVTARWSMGIDTNFYWAASTLALSPLSYGFAVYYFCAVTALGAHIGAALQFAGRPASARIALVIGATVGAIIVTIFSGGFYDITLPPAYQDYAQMLRQMFGLN
jgi:hypothetical protein